MSAAAPFASQESASTDPLFREVVCALPQEAWGEVRRLAPEGIFLPLSEYRGLFERAWQAYLEEEQRRETKIRRPDLAPEVLEADYRGEIRDTVIRFRATLQIVQTRDEAAFLDLPFQGILPGECRLNGREAQLTDSGKGYRLVLPEGGGTHTLKCSFDVPLDFREKRSRAVIAVPPVPAGRITVFSKEYYRVVFSNLAVSRRIERDGRVEVTGWLDGTRSLAIDVFNRRSTGHQDVKVYSREYHEIAVSKNRLEALFHFQVNVRDGELSDLLLELPPALSVSACRGTGVAGWDHRVEDGTGHLEIRFSVPVKEAVRFEVRAFRFLESGGEEQVFEGIRMPGCFDRGGTLGVYYSDRVRLEILDARGLQASETSEYSTPCDSLESTFNHLRNYRIFDLPYRLRFAHRDVPDELDVRSRTSLHFERHRAALNARVSLRGFTEPVSRFRFAFPEGYFLRKIEAHVDGKPVAEYHDIDPESGMLVVDTRIPPGTNDIAVFRFTGERMFDEKKLDAGPLRLEIPRVLPEKAENLQERLELRIDPFFEISGLELSGYDPNREGMTVPPSNKAGGRRLFYTCRGRSPRGTITLSRRKPRKTVEAVNYLALDRDLLQVNSYLRFELSEGTASRFYFAVPAWEGSRIHIEGSRVKEKNRLNPAEYLERAPDARIAAKDLEGMEVWETVLEKDTSGPVILQVDYSKKWDLEGDFETVPLIRPLLPGGVSGYLVMEASKTTEIAIQKSGLNEVEAFELPEWPAYKPSRRIIESLRFFGTGFEFALSARKRSESPVLAAFAEYAGMRYVLGEDANLFFEFEWRLRNAGLQFLEIPLPPGHEIWSVVLDGKGIKPRKAGPRGVSIPLAAEETRSQRLKIRGTVSRNRTDGAFKKLRVRGGALPVPCFESGVILEYPERFTPVSVRGNFRELPKALYGKPVLLRWLGRMNPARLLRGPFGDGLQKSMSPARETALAEIEVDGQLSSYDPNMPQRLMKKRKARAPAPAKASTKTMVDSRAGRRKGLLSLEFELPRGGRRLEFHKPWKDPRLSVLWMSREMRAVLSILVFLAAWGLGNRVSRKNIAGPVGFLAAWAVVSTGVPLIAFRGWTFLFDAALGGALVHLLSFRFFRDSVRKPRRGAAGRRVLTAILAFAAFSQSPDAGAAEARRDFPNPVRVFVPYGETVPFEPAGEQSVYIPTRDYFGLKMLADPPYSEKPVLAHDRAVDLASFRAEGVVGEKRIRFSARIGLFVNRDTWETADLFFQNVFVESIKLDGRTVPVVSASPEPYPVSKRQVLPPFPGRFRVPVLGRGAHALDLVFYVDIESLRGKKSIDFGFPAVPCSETRILFESRGLLLDLVEPNGGSVAEETEKGTAWSLATSGKSRIRLRWYPKKYVKEAEKPLLFTSSEIRLEADPDGVRFDQSTEIRVEKSSVALIRLEKPAGLAVDEVLSPNVRNWTVQKENGTEFMDLVLKKESTESVALRIRGRYPAEPGAPLPALFMKPAGATRVQGRIHWFVRKRFRLDTGEIRGLHQSGEPPGLAESRLQDDYVHEKSYSFQKEGFRGTFRLLPEKPEARLESRLLYRVEENRTRLEVGYRFEIRKGALTGITLRCPEGYRVDDINDGEGGATAWRWMEDPDGKRIHIPFHRAVSDRLELVVDLEKEGGIEPELSFEGFVPEGFDKHRGTLYVTFPQSYRVRETGCRGARAVPPGREIKSYIMKDESREVPIYAFEFRDADPRVSFETERRRPRVDAVRVNHLKVGDEGVEARVLGIFRIRRAPLDRFTVRVPRGIADAVDIRGEDIKTLVRSEADPSGESVDFIVHTLSEIEGAYLLDIGYTRYFGTEKTFRLPPIDFPEASEVIEFVAVEADTAYQVEALPGEGFRDIDRDRVPAFPAEADPARVLWSFRCLSNSDRQFAVKLKRLEREKLVEAKILRQDIVTRVFADGAALHEVDWLVTNRVLQFLPLTLPPGMQVWSARVAGEPVRPAIEDGDPGPGGETRYGIPLVKSGAGDRRFNVELVLHAPGSAMGLFGRVPLPMLETGDLAVEKTTWTLYLPEPFVYPRFRHNMQETVESVIEADKTFDLAKEYAYWTKMAESSTGKLRQSAIENRREVFRDYQSQKALSSNLQRRLPDRGDKGKLQQQALEQNAKLLDRSDDLVRRNRALRSRKIEPGGAKVGTGLAGRERMKGWQIKTRGFEGQNDVRESIATFLQNEKNRREREKAEREAKRLEARRRQAQQKARILERQRRRQAVRKKLESRRIVGDADSLKKHREETPREMETAGRAARYEIVVKDGKDRFAKTKSRARPQAPAAGFDKSGVAGSDSRQDSDAGMTIDYFTLSDSLGGGVTMEKEIAAGEPLETTDEESGAAVPEKLDFAEPPVPTVQQAEVPVQQMRQSALLGGMRSMEIPVPRRGKIVAFHKLGGNPRMRAVYFDRRIPAVLLKILLFAAVLFGAVRLRRLRVPVRSLFGRAFRERLTARGILLMQSRMLKALPTLLMALSLLAPFPYPAVYLFTAGLGWNTVLLLRYVSHGRYRKKGFVPPFYYKIFLKYLLSYVVMAASLLAPFHPLFFGVLVLAVALNTLWLLVYSVITLCTREVDAGEPS